jgi:V8-like Glu-specific endopeptidase
VTSGDTPPMRGHREQFVDCYDWDDTIRSGAAGAPVEWVQIKREVDMQSMRGRWSWHSCALAVFAAACSSGNNGEPEGVGEQKAPIIFGQDDRLNVASHFDQKAAIWADSVAILGEPGSLCIPNGDDCTVALTPMSTLVLTDPSTDPVGGPLCSDQRFADESRAAGETCTAFYVGNNRFITAAHCIDAAKCNDDPISGAGVLFGFTTDAQGNVPTSVPRDGNFYTCQSIVQRELQVLNPGRIDYAIFEVTPPVVGHRPLTLRRSGAISAGPPAESTPATPLGVIGHGLGLPMKASLNGQTRNNTNTSHFYHTIDGFPGDSGSPVMNLLEGVVEGIHVAGPVPQSGVPPQGNFSVRNDNTPDRCLAYTSCAENACPANQVNRQWSQATRITRSQLLANVPEVASPPEEHVLILLDRTGSMTEPGTADGLTKWDDAINAAMGWVAVDSLTASLFTRAYSVWTFRRGDGQDGLVQVWPESGSADCANVDPESGFCVFERVDPLEAASDYFNLQAELEDIRTEHAPVVGPTTPLAESVCDVLETLRPLPALQRIIFQSDGGENSSASAHPCAGDNSAEFENPLENPELLEVADWGMTLDSWQAKVIRRATRFARAIDDAVASPLTPTDGFPVGLVWNVDVHFALLPAPEPMGFLAFGAQTGSASEWQGLPAAGPSLLGPSSAAAAQTTTSILPAELAFFRTLGTSNALSRFRTYVRPLEPQVYGVDHARQGDVDDSGCVDQADLSIMTQTDVWMQRAALPLEIGTRADLSRDGWVNFADLEILLDHWASGCNNPVPPPNLGAIVLPGQGSCSDAITNGTETDVDCGGSSCPSCPDGSVCEGASDCESAICSSNVCQPEPPFELCECRPNKCSDCSNAVSTCEATVGCTSIVACTFQSACTFPHENCSGGQSCFAATGYPQSSAAGQAANNVISCFGGC